VLHREELVETTFLNDLWRTVMTGVTHLAWPVIAVRVNLRADFYFHGRSWVPFAFVTNVFGD
jgi:hypothetical protein